MLSIPYATYEELRLQGALGERVSGRTCPRATCGGTLSLSDREETRVRGVVWLRQRTFVYEKVTIQLATCCKGARPHQVRVLPVDILPQKLYSLPAQEAVVAAYLDSGKGLRSTLAEFDGEVPHFSTLHGWVGGLGRYARERPPDPPSGLLFAGVRHQIEEHLFPDFSRLWDEPVHIDPLRYKSNAKDDASGEVRRDDLEGAVRILRGARAVSPGSVRALTSLVRSLLLRTDLEAPPGYWARVRGPPSDTGDR